MTEKKELPEMVNQCVGQLRHLDNQIEDVVDELDQARKAMEAIEIQEATENEGVPF
jgi:hypothetical protein